MRISRGILVLGFLIAGLFVLAPATAWAQASITGIVRDSSGAVLPGVIVEAASPSLIEKVRTATTDGNPTPQPSSRNVRPPPTSRAMRSANTRGRRMWPGTERPSRRYRAAESPSPSAP